MFRGGLRNRRWPGLCWRGWWWRRRRWGQWLQKFQGLGARPQLSIKQQHEGVMRDLGILRQLWRDVQLRHFRQWKPLLHLPPFSKEVLDLLLNHLLPGDDREEQYHLRTGLGEHLPGARRGGSLLAGQ